MDVCHFDLFGVYLFVEIKEEKYDQKQKKQDANYYEDQYEKEMDNNYQWNQLIYDYSETNLNRFVLSEIHQVIEMKKDHNEIYYLSQKDVDNETYIYCTNGR